MTVSSQTNNATFVGNGVTTDFPLPFRFFSNSDVFAYFIDPTTGASTPMVLGTDYTLTGAGEPEVNGNAVSVLTTTAPLANLRGLYVERIMQEVQSTDIVNQGEFFASTHEDVFDRLTMLIQQANANSHGAIRVAIGDPEPQRLAPAARRANRLLGFDALGQPIDIAPVLGSATDLAINLENNTDPAKGAALVGFLQAGAGAVGRTMLDKAREVVSVKDFGAVGDGVTDDTAAITDAIAAGKSVYFPPGNYRLETLLSISTNNVCLYGDGNSSRLFSANLVRPVRLLSCTNVRFDGLFFETTASSASNDVFGVIYADNAALSDVTFERCKFSSQNANTNGVKIINDGGNIAERIAFIGCEFVNIGRMGIEFQNHNNLDAVYRFKRITIERCYFKNIGLLQSFGMGISLSGYGERCSVTNNSFDNCWSMGIECVGFRDALFEGNTFEGFETRSYNPISVTGSRVMTGLTIRDNKVLGSNAGRWNLYTMSNCVVSGNLLRSGYFFIRDTSDSLFKDNFIYQNASDPYSVYLEGVCARNRFTANYLDGSLSTVANQGTVVHNNTESGITDTVYQDCRIIKSPYSSALTGTTVGNTRVENCVIDGVLYTHLSPVAVRKGTLQITSVSGVSKLTIDGFNSVSWTTRIIRFSVHGIANDSTGRVAAERYIEVRGQGANLPEIGGTATIIESGCTITYGRNAGLLTIICTNNAGQNASHRWEWEIIGSAVGNISVST